MLALLELIVFGLVVSLYLIVITRGQILHGSVF